MHHIVLDEADLLLSGGFERDVGRVLEGMKQNDRERKAQCVSQELGLSLGHFQALPRHVKAAAYEGEKNSLPCIPQSSCRPPSPHHPTHATPESPHASSLHPLHIHDFTPPSHPFASPWL